MSETNLTVEERVAKLEEQMKSILEGHDGRKRDDLKDEVDHLKVDVENKKDKGSFF